MYIALCIVVQARYIAYQSLVQESRDTTSCHHHGTSSLSPVQFMDQEMACNTVEGMLLISFQVLKIAALLIVLYHFYDNVVSQWERVVSITASAVLFREHCLRVLDSIDLG